MTACEKCGKPATYSVTCAVGCTHHGCDHCFWTAVWHLHTHKLRDRRALPPDGPDIGADVPGGGAI